MNQHPNAAVAGGGTGVAAAVIWIASLLHVTLTAYEAVGIAGVLTTVVLFIGRRGIKGAFSDIWNGNTIA